MNYLDEIIEELKLEEERIIKSRWALGWHDRGLGRGDYSIILAGQKYGEPILELPDGNKHQRELAEHIIKIHNRKIKEPLLWIGLSLIVLSIITVICIF